MFTTVLAERTRRGRYRVPLLAAGLLTLSPALSAAEPPASDRHSHEVIQALRPLVEEWGPDAVNLQGNLLRNAIQAGSLLDASAAVSGVELREGKPYLVLQLETGIAYPTSRVSADERLRRIWQDVVEPSLQPCRSLRLPADGVELRVTYSHAHYANREDLARVLRAGEGVAETANFRLMVDDIVEFANARISAQELADRSGPHVDGRPAPILLVD